MVVISKIGLISVVIQMCDALRYELTNPARRVTEVVALAEFAISEELINYRNAGCAWSTQCQ